MGMVAIGCAISTYGKGCSDARARERGSPSAVSCARQDGSRRVVCTLCTVHCTDANGTLLYSLVLTYSTDETHGETMYEAVRYLLLTLRLSFHEPLLLSAGRSGSGLWTRVWRPAHCSHDGQRGQRGWPRGGGDTAFSLRSIANCCVHANRWWPLQSGGPTFGCQRSRRAP